jgi:hypothetical protein
MMAVTDQDLYLSAMRKAADLRFPGDVLASKRVRTRRKMGMCATPDCMRSVRRLSHQARVESWYCLACLWVAGFCATCRTALPEGSRADRKTCSDKCRKALQLAGNPGRAVKKPVPACSECRKPLTATRSHANTCSDRCRQARSRRLSQENLLALPRKCDKGLAKAHVTG